MVDNVRHSDNASIAHLTTDSSQIFSNQISNEQIAQYMQSRKTGNVYDSNAEVPNGLPKLQLTAETMPMDGALAPLQKPLAEGGYKQYDWTSPDGKVTIPVFMPTPKA